MTTEWTLVTKPGDKASAEIRSIFEQSNLEFKEVTITSPRIKESIEQLIGKITKYPQIILTENDQVIPMDAPDFKQFMAFNEMNESNIDLDDLIESCDIGDLSCLEG